MRPDEELHAGAGSVHRQRWPQFRLQSGQLSAQLVDFVQSGAQGSDLCIAIGLLGLELFVLPLDLVDPSIALDTFGFQFGNALLLRLDRGKSHAGEVAAGLCLEGGAWTGRGVI